MSARVRRHHDVGNHTAAVSDQVEIQGPGSIELSAHAPEARLDTMQGCKRRRRIKQGFHHRHTVQIGRPGWIRPSGGCPPRRARHHSETLRGKGLQRGFQQGFATRVGSRQITAERHDYGLVQAILIDRIFQGLAALTFHPTDRLALFIDGANLYSAAKALGFDIDYRKLLDEFRKRGVLIRAYYYTAINENDDYSPIRPLVDWLDYNGFTLVTKPAREFTDSQGRKRWRGDMDVEIAVDMLQMAETADHLVLFSGDGDFRALVEAVQRKGRRVTVVSTMKSQPPMTSDDLRRQADDFVDLNDLANIVGRPQRAPAPRPMVDARTQAEREADDEY